MIHVQIKKDLSIPDGYTYKRCDRYSPKEFREFYLNERGYESEDCKEYMEEYQKEFYTNDDKIAIHERAFGRIVGSMFALTGKNTTKRYKYDEV